MPEGIPNLDDCTDADRAQYAKVFQSLMNYCTVKTWAAINRRGGAIQTASKFETECEEIYKQLPEWARW
jgi:hypothetical protein